MMNTMFKVNEIKEQIELNTPMIETPVLNS